MEKRYNDYWDNDIDRLIDEYIDNLHKQQQKEKEVLKK